MAKISNTFIVGFPGTILTSELKTKLLEIEPPGIILYDTNIESREQVKKLTQDLKDLLGENLLISVDQEGGKVERLRKISPSLLSMLALGEIEQSINGDIFSVYSELLAQDLMDLGFNLVYAPCLDLNSNSKNPIIGTRSLGSSPSQVSRQSIKLIKE